MGLDQRFFWSRWNWRVEPREFRLLRDAYYERWRQLCALEGRLCMTDSGMAFVYRVKAIPCNKP